MAAPNPFAKMQAGQLFQLDYSYLEAPGAERTEYYEMLKRLAITDDLRVDIGGQFRYQFKNMNTRSHFLGVPTVPRTDTFGLTQLRLYTNFLYQDWLRVYGSFIDANSHDEDLPPLGIDENRNDLHLLFADIKLFDDCCGRETWLRAGRFELLYGAQRLMTPFPWANTRKRWEGAKLYGRGPVWDWEMFWGRKVLTRGDTVRKWDTADQSKWYGILWADYKGLEDSTISPFLFITREEDRIPGPPVGRTHRIGSGRADTVWYTPGVRINGGRDNWLWDVEGALQLGPSGSKNIVAGMFTAGLGRKVPDVKWTPTVWLWYDYASGDDDPGGDINTFNQLEPLAHKYFGWTDLVGRQNIHDLNFQLILKPHEKVTLIGWAHFLWLAESRDGLYNPAGFVSHSGGSDTEVGQALDLMVRYNIRPGLTYEAGYSHFWPGNFIKQSGGLPDSSYFVYNQVVVNF